jgi:raffinose/stachyose/melibiose transport system permease protein
MTRRGERTVTYVILSVFAAITLYPIVGTVLEALTPESSLATGLHIPWPPDWNNFAGAWTTGQFSLFLRSSAIVAVIVVVVSSVLSIMAGYALGTIRFRGSKVFFYFVLLGLIVPSEATIIPLYYDLRGIGLTDTYWSVILPDIGVSVAFGTFWMRAFFLSAPRSLLEAARIDGASTWSVLWRVLVPLARPAILTMMVLECTWTWNDFLLPLVMLQTPNVTTAPLGISQFVLEFTSEYQQLAAAAIIVALPIVIVYIFLQRHFIRGMISGAMKL